MHIARKPSWAGLFEAGGCAVCATTILGFLGSWNWRFDICSHFRVQYVACLFAAVMVLALFRRRTSALLFLGFAAVNAALVVPFYDRPPHATTGASIRILSCNVHTENRQFDRALEMVREEKPDIAFFMEVDDAWLEHLLALTNEMPHVIAHPRSDNFGVALFTRMKPMAMDIIWPGGEVPSVAATIPFNGTSLVFIGTHPVPPGSHEAWAFRNLQLDEIAKHAAKESGPVVIAGDLNMSPWSPFFRRLIVQSGLKDTERGFGFQPTWPTYQPILFIPLDHVLISRGLTVVDRRTGRRTGSDHLPVIVDTAPSP